MIRKLNPTIADAN